jgi:plastocyanin
MRRLSAVVLLALCTQLSPGHGRAQSGATGSYALEIRDAAGAPVENAVVTLYADGAPLASRKRAAPRAIMDQRNRQFIPHVLAVQRGTAVTFPNSDMMRHHVYSFSAAKRFELKLYSGLPPQPIVFDTAGEVVLGCNIHDSMIGYIYVVDSPYFAATAAAGLAQLRELPPGRYRVEIWHPQAAALRYEIALGEGEQRSEARQLEVRKDGGPESGAAAREPGYE